MQLKITVLEGDGIGPEVTREAVRALHASADLNGHKFEFTAGQIGGDAIKQSGTPLPRATLDMCMASDAVLLGAVGSPEFDLLPAAQRPEAGLLLLRRQQIQGRSRSEPRDVLLGHGVSGLDLVARTIDVVQHHLEAELFLQP